MRKPVHAAVLAVTDAKRMNAGDIARMAAGKKPPLYSFVQAAGFNKAAAAAHKADHGIIINQGSCLIGRHETNPAHDGT
jgi:hypothetical protein